jgi:hypothetical protein
MSSFLSNFIIFFLISLLQQKCIHKLKINYLYMVSSWILCLPINMNVCVCVCGEGCSRSHDVCCIHAYARCFLAFKEARPQEECWRNVVYIAGLIFFVVTLLQQYVLSDICLNCFSIKETEKGRERGMRTGLSN